MTVIPSLESCQHSGLRRWSASLQGTDCRPTLEPLEARTLPAASSVGASTQFVLQMYQDLLGRTANGMELTFWRALLDGRTQSREQVVRAVMGSAEYNLRTITNHYDRFLERAPTDAEAAWWVARLRAGVPGREVEAGFLRSDDFYLLHSGTNEEWISAVYQVALGRAPDGGGVTYWTGLMSQGVSRDVVISALLGSREARLRVIADAYNTYLHRGVDGSGQTTMLAFLGAGHSPQNLAVLLITSPEYYSGYYTDFSEHVANQPKPSTVLADSLPAGNPSDEGKPVNKQGVQKIDPTPPGSSTTPQTKDDIVARNPPSASSLPGSPAFGPLPRDINVSNQPTENHVELSLATNPTNPDNVAIFTTTQDTAGLTSVDLYYSFDAGNTWTLNRIDQAEDGIAATFRFDPNLVFDANGRMHLVYGIFDPVTNTGPSYVIAGRSDDGGITVQTSIVVQDNVANIFNDKWLITAGPAPGGAPQQNVYIGWVRFGPGSTVPTLHISGSVDGGVTWSAPQRVSDTQNTQFAAPAVGPDGTIYIGFVQNNDIVIDRSTTFNGTAGSFNFGTDIVVTTMNLAGFQIPVPSQPDREISVIPILIADRSSGPNSGNLYITFADQVPGGNPSDFDTYVVRSTDGGTTWTPRLRINDDTGTNTQFNPWIAVDQVGNGCLVTSWRDARQDPANGRLDVFTSVSEDGGVTWSQNVLVSDAPSDETAGPDPNDFLEYDGLDFVLGRADYAWSDNSRTPNGNKEVFYDSILTSCGSVPDDALELNETSDTATYRGTLRRGFTDVVPALNINLHQGTFLPDYDWFRYRPEQNGTFTVTIGPSANSLELQLFTLDANNTLVPVASSVAGGSSTRRLVAPFQAGQEILVEVKGRHLRPGVFGQGSYTLDVSFV